MATSDSQTSAPNKGFDLLRRRVRGHQGMIIGSVIVVSVLLIALLAPLLAPHDPYQQDLLKRLVPPVWDSRGSWEHVLGTDHLGRDYLSRLIYGARISLLIGIGAALISGIIGTIMGVMAGYFGGRVDMIVTFMITVRLSMPVVLVALAVVAIVGGSLQVVIAVLGLLLWDRFAVVMRSSTLQIRSMDYVAAARAVGCSTSRVLMTEVMPNVVNNLIVITTIEIAHAIILEAALSFLGLGVQDPVPAWGLMLTNASEFFEGAPWVAIYPGVAISLSVFGFNLFGDAVRDTLDPKLRSR